MRLHDTGQNGDFRIFTAELHKNRLMLIMFIKQLHPLLKLRPCHEMGEQIHNGT